jgi:arylsulfatase A-like enzyme
VARYDAEIEHTDLQIGVLFDALGERGVFDNTIVVVVADHGEAFLEHGNFSHQALYDELIHIPMLVRYPPSVPAGPTVAAPVRLMEVSSTVLSLAGVQAAARLQAELTVWCKELPSLATPARLNGGQSEGLKAVGYMEDVP